MTTNKQWFENEEDELRLSTEGIDQVDPIIGDTIFRLIDGEKYNERRKEEFNFCKGTVDELTKEELIESRNDYYYDTGTDDDVYIDDNELIQLITGNCESCYACPFKIEDENNYYDYYAVSKDGTKLIGMDYCKINLMLDGSEEFDFPEDLTPNLIAYEAETVVGLEHLIYEGTQEELNELIRLEKEIENEDEDPTEIIGLTGSYSC